MFKLGGPRVAAPRCLAESPLLAPPLRAGQAQGWGALCSLFGKVRAGGLIERRGLNWKPQLPSLVPQSTTRGSVHLFHDPSSIYYVPSISQVNTVTKDSTQCLSTRIWILAPSSPLSGAGSNKSFSSDVSSAAVHDNKPRFRR